MNARRGGVAGLVLAGGMARRMGACKVLLPVAGCGALEQLVSRMRAGGVGRIVVVTGGYADRTRAEALRLGCTPAHNPDYETGMFSSVLAGVRALPPDADAFFLIPGDTPLVKPATYRMLIDAFDAPPDDEAPDAVHPEFCGERGHPPLIRGELAAKVLSWGGMDGMRGFLEAHAPRRRTVAVADRAVLLDMDTPEDYETLQRYAQTEWYPDPGECAALWDIAGTPVKVRAHMRAVASCAERVAGALVERGCTLNVPMLASAALLHDIAKGSPEHERVGARYLDKAGYEQVAQLVAAHTDLPGGLGPEDSPPNEAELLYLCDKLLDGTAFLTPEARMEQMEARFPAGSTARNAARARLHKAAVLRDRVEALLGSTLTEALAT
jgi:Uncharacterized MobA-related protein